MPTLNANTIVTHPKTGEPVVLLAGDEIPEWALEPQGEKGDKPAIVGDHLIAGLQPADAPSDPADPPADVDEVPPASGKGSGIEAWQQYAQHKGIAYPEDATRDEIIAAVEAHRADQQ